MFQRRHFPTLEQLSVDVLALFGVGRGRDELLTRMLARAVADNRDVALMCEAFSRDSWHWREPALRTLAGRVADGVPLEVAAREVPDALPVETRWAIGCGADTGTLPETLDLAAHVLARRRSPAAADRRHQTQYLTVVLLAMAAIVSFIMYYIIPKFKAIFSGFGTELPGITVALIRISDFVVDYYFLFALALGGLAYVQSRERSRFWNQGALAFPATFASRAPRAAPNLLRLLAIAADRGLPWQPYLHTLIEQPLPGWMGRSLFQVHRRVAEGHSLWNALWTTGWLHPWELTALEQSERIGNTAWTLRELANTRELRRDYRATVRGELLRPAGLLALALIVGFVVVALFVPVVKLLNDLS